MRAEAGVDELVLLGLQVEHGRLARALIDREDLGVLIVRALLAPVRIVHAAHGRGEPNPTVLAHHGVVVVGAGVPERLRRPNRPTAPRASPRRHDPGRARAACSGSATGILKNDTVLVFGSSSGALSVEYSGEPNSRPLPFTVGSRRSDEIRSCMYLSGADQSQVVTTRLRSTPAGRGGLLLGSSPLATRSVQSPKYLYGTPLELAGDAVGHHLAGLAGLDAAHPGVGAAVELAELRRDGAGRLLAELMTTDAVGVVHLLDPVGARDVLRNLGRAAEVLLRRNLHHRVPVDRRIIMRGGGLRRRRYRGMVQVWPGLARIFGESTSP